MILLTGATGLVGAALLPRLLSEGREVRCLVREPRRLGPNRVRVQITLGDLGDAVSLRQAVRGVDTVVHLAATIRDQPGGSIEELNGIATVRLLRAAERAGVSRFVFFGAIGAVPSSPARFFRAKALATRAVLDARLDSRVLSPSIVYAPGDRFLTLLERMSLLPWMPVAGKGLAAFQPIWAQDVAGCVLAALDRDLPIVRERALELAGPDSLTYEQIVRLVLEARGRSRPLVHVPLGLVRRSLRTIERLSSNPFATWEEAQLMEMPMIASRGTEDARTLGADPKPMAEVLGLQ
ncbi:MAG: NAD(P)H-binding protein [Solirubrobacterales bacterium]